MSGIVPYLAHLKSCEIHLLTRLRIAPYLSISHDTMRLGARDESPHRSPHLHTSPQNTNSLSPHSTRSHVAGGTREISPYLPTFSHTPPYLTRIYCWRREIHLPTSPDISAYLPISHGHSPDLRPYLTLLPISPHLSRHSDRGSGYTNPRYPTRPKHGALAYPPSSFLEDRFSRRRELCEVSVFGGRI